MFTMDFGVRDITGKLTVLVEARARRRSTPHWAAELRSNLMEADERLRRSFGDVFFVLVTPQALYMWPPSAGDRDLPAVEVKSADVLAPYFRQLGVKPNAFIEPVVFDAIVQTWLFSLASGAPGDAAQLPQLSELVDRIHGGTVVAEVAA